jgi:hypothetical protein
MLVLCKYIWQVFLLQNLLVKIQEIDEDFVRRKKKIELRDGHFVNY